MEKSLNNAGDTPQDRAGTRQEEGVRAGQTAAPSFVKEEEPREARNPEGDPGQTQLPNLSSLLALYGMEVDVRTFSPLALAFLGDAVYSLIIRTSVLAKGNRQAEKLHNETTRLVRAQKQAAIGRTLYDLLTTEEQKVYRRGRNSNPMHRAKGASLEEYLQATALETLCGWLYLQGRTERLMELIRTGLELTRRRDGEPLL
ncbi:MAG: ribonuclease III domain-containing protein [Eubacteriales bacterium]|nr:ribonuclease III domain-containing protein [Eubacteriales bacterium]